MKHEIFPNKWIQENALTITLQLVGVLIIVLNLWLTSKLGPITQDLTILSHRVSAIEKLEETLYTRKEMEILFQDINRRLESIEKKFP